MDPLLTIVMVVLLLMAEGFFSGSELALASFNRIRLRHLAESGVAYAKTFEQLLASPERIFGATSVGTNLSVFASSAIVTAYFTGVFAARADLYSILLMGPLTLVLGEIVPKAMFRPNIERLGPFIAPPLNLSQTLFAPVLALTTAITRFLFKIVLRRRAAHVKFVTREEILHLTKLSEERLDLDVDEKKMIDRIFEFKTTTVEAAMQPLANIAAVSDVSTIEQARAHVAETGFSRLPVYHERVYDIVGIISAFDILRQKDRSATVVNIMTPAHYVPNTKKNARLLEEMQEAGIHMSVVVDEYGAAVGIVTLEDLLEEIVGEIEDEHDTRVKSYETIDENKYLIDAAMEIDLINDELGLDLPTGDYETLGGFLNASLERIPRNRERIAIGDYYFRIADTTPRKVKSVEVLDLRGDPGVGDKVAGGPENSS